MIHEIYPKRKFKDIAQCPFNKHHNKSFSGSVAGNWRLIESWVYGPMYMGIGGCKGRERTKRAFHDLSIKRSGILKERFFSFLQLILYKIVAQCSKVKQLFILWMVKYQGIICFCLFVCLFVFHFSVCLFVCFYSCVVILGSQRYNKCNLGIGHSILKRSIV